MNRTIALFRREYGRKLCKALQSAGWQITIGGKHFRLISPRRGKVFASLTPSDRRAEKNLRSDLSRHGLDTQGR